MKIWYCATCGYEVDARGRCHLCRRKLISSPMEALEPGPEDQEVGYRLDGWADRTRGRLIDALNGAQVRHRFEDDDLVVGVDDEQRTDELVERVAAGAALDEVPEGDEADPELVAEMAAEVSAEVAASLSMLERAASRLRADPTDMEADAEVAEASAGVFVVESWPGCDDDTWAAIGRVTRRLLAALGADDALEEEIRTEAAVLTKLLDPVLAPVREVPDEGGALPGGDGPVAADGAVDGATGEALEPSDGDDGDRVALEDEEASRVADEALGRLRNGEPPQVEVSDDRADVALLGGGPETVYEAPHWLPDQRALLGVLLDGQAIPHVWDGTDLVVPSTDEQQVEDLFDRIGGVDDEEDDETRYRYLEELFAAVGRLASDPEDEGRRADVVAAAVAVEGPTPLGYDDGQWLSLRRRTRALTEAVGGDVGAEVVAGQAAEVRDMLRALV